MQSGEAATASAPTTYDGGMLSFLRALLGMKPRDPVYVVGDTVYAVRGLLILGGYVDQGATGIVIAVADQRLTVDFDMQRRTRRTVARVKLHPSFVRHLHPL